MPAPVNTVFNTAFYNRILNSNGPNSLDVWDANGDTGGTLLVSSTINRRTNGFSLDVWKNAPSSTTLYRRKDFQTASNKWAGRFYVFFQQMPNIKMRIFGLDDSLGVVNGLRFSVDSSAFRTEWGTFASNPAPNVIVTGTWYRIDFKCNTSANAFVTDWMINGVPQPTHIFTGTAGTQNQLTFGVVTSSTGTCRINYTDAIVSQTITDYPIGAGMGWALLPNSVITGSWNVPDNFRNDNMTAVDANSWNRLDEWPPSTGSTSDYVKQITIMSTGYIPFGIQDRLDSGQGVINGVEAFVGYTSSGTSANTGAAVVKRLDQTEVGIFGSTTGRGDYSDGSINDWWFGMVQVDKPTGGWTTQEINGLQFRIGYSTDVSPQPFWGALLLEYDVSVPSPYRAAVVGG